MFNQFWTVLFVRSGQEVIKALSEQQEEKKLRLDPNEDENTPMILMVAGWIIFCVVIGFAIMAALS